MNKFGDWLVKNGYNPVYLGIIRDLENKNGEAYYYSKSDISDLIKRCGFRSIESIDEFETLINRYYEWYEKTVFGKNINKRIELSQTEKRKGSFVPLSAKGYISRSDLDIILSKCRSASEAFVILGLYEGIGSYGYKLTDIVFTKASGINVKDKTITLYSGKKFKFSDRLIDIAIKAAEEDISYDSAGKQYRNTNSGTIYRYKQMASESEDPDNRSAMISRLLQRFKIRTDFKNVSAPTLLRSGLLNSITDRLDGMPLNSETVCLCSDILEKYNVADVSLRALKDKFILSKPL